MIQFVSLFIGTFTVLCMLTTFGISWMVLGAIHVPDFWAFVLSTLYSLIPVALWIYEERTKSEENHHAPRITPVLDDNGSSTPDVSNSQRTSKRKRSGNNKAKPVQSGGDGTSS